MRVLIDVNRMESYLDHASTWQREHQYVEQTHEDVLCKLEIARIIGTCPSHTVTLEHMCAKSYDEQEQFWQEDKYGLEIRFPSQEPLSLGYCEDTEETRGFFVIKHLYNKASNIYNSLNEPIT